MGHIVEAAQRLHSMAITQGDNYGRGKETAKKLLNLDLADCEILNHHEEQVLISNKTSYEIIYVLLKIGKSFAEFESILNDEDSWAGTLKHAGARSVQAHITLNVSDSSVYSVWVDKSVRGQGYGKALYNVAYQYSKKGIESSDDLGTFSLGTWLSLYKANPKIFIENKRQKIPRSEIEIEDLKIIYKHKQGDIDLTAPETSSFIFVWPK